MKTLLALLNKTYDKKLEDHKEYKKKLQEMKSFLNKNKISCKESDDLSCLRYEILVASIKNKQQLEEVFFDTYVKMHDYWYDLTYLERKKQMNVDIDRKKAELSHFVYENEEIYMPCFDERFNHLYHTEIVLLDLKQYHVFIREFEKEIKYDLYGALPYVHGFSSCEVVAQMGDSYVLFQPDVKRFYYFEHGSYREQLSLDDKLQEIDGKQRNMIAMLFLLGRDEDIAIELMNGSLVQDKMKKKIKKLMEKQHKTNKNNT